MTIRERSEESNKEIITIGKKPIPLKDYLLQNKVLVAVVKDEKGAKKGFFKLFNNFLQLHICIPKGNKKKEWHRFLVLDATEEEKQRNISLNYIEAEEKDGTKSS